MQMYNLIEYSNNYSKTSGSLWQYCKDILAADNNGAIVNFYGNNATNSRFKSCCCHLNFRYGACFKQGVP